MDKQDFANNLLYGNLYREKKYQLSEWGEWYSDTFKNLKMSRLFKSSQFSSFHANSAQSNISSTKSITVYMVLTDQTYKFRISHFAFIMVLPSFIELW